MTPDAAIASAKSGNVPPVLLVIGEEGFLQNAVLSAVRATVIGDADLGLNEDQMVAGDADVDQVLAACRTLPMMGTRRLVVVRALERWEPRGEGKSKSKGSTSPLDRLAEYAKDAADTTTLVLVADKLDARRRLVSTAKKNDFLVACEPPSRNALPGWVAAAAKRRGKKLAPGIADLLAEITGPELARIDDALERLALYVGDGPLIDEEAVSECIVSVKPSTVWELVDCVGRRDLGGSLRSLERVYDPHDRGLRLVGVLAWSTRQLIRFSSASRSGLSPADAAKKAGAPPFKARDLSRQVQRLSQRDLDGWLDTLSAVDLSLKGGSKRPPKAILEAAIVSMCTGRYGQPRASLVRAR